jgi:hypothetical protein
MYVQAVHADLKDAPKMSAGKVATLTRGDELAIVSKESVWFEVKKGAAHGWISRLFLSAHPPVGKADLQKDVPATLEKASRRRPSSYAVAAATRGVMLGERAREGREMYETDYDALEKMEAVSIDQGKLDKFVTSAKLTVN